MTQSSLIIVTDRGSLKAYRVDETPTRGPSLQLVQAFNITDAHGKLVDKVSDLAGRFPVSDGAGGRHANSIAERTQLETETDRRIHKQLADQIVKLVQSDRNEGWSLAAPASIHAAIVDLLPASVRDRIVEHVKSDLVKTEPSKLSAHFRSLQPM
jgi:Protein required for attachment to host cells